MKKLLALLSLVLVLVIPMSLVSANVEDCGSKSVTRGTPSAYVTGNEIIKSSSATTAACVNLKGFQAPGLPPNVVSTNDLVFRVYASDGSQATEIVNYRYFTASENCRQYMIYKPGKGANGAEYSIVRSLNSTSCSSYCSYYIKWNP